MFTTPVFCYLKKLRGLGKKLKHFEKETQAFWLQNSTNRPTTPAKVCLIIIVSNSGADNSASRHDSLNLKGSAESGEKND